MSVAEFLIGPASFPWLVLFGLIVGALGGFFGVGGGFLMTPLLMMIGIPPTIAAATDANQIVAASASGTFAHWRLGNVDFKMGLYLLVGGFLGGAGGVAGVTGVKLELEAYDQYH